MKTSLCKNLLLIILLAPLGIDASETPSQTPTIDFSSQSMRELVEFQRNNNIQALTPRSHQSYASRFRALANQSLNDLRAQLGITPERMDQGDQQPAISVIFIVPAAAHTPNVGHAGGHGPNCICHLLDQFMQRTSADGQSEMDTSDEESENEDQANDEGLTAQLAKLMHNLRFNRQQ